MYLKFRYFVFLIVLIFSLPIKNYAQSDNVGKINDNQLQADNISVVDSSDNVDQKSKDSFIDTKVIYSATDSIVLSRDSKRVYLYKEAQVEYGDVILKADYIEYDQENNYVFAKGVLDTLGNLNGKPEFKEKDDEFVARTIKYNFKTKKGYIEDVFTEEEQGYLHSQQTQKLEDNSFLLKDGKYTTCENEEHPHFYLSMSKAKVVPNDKIISGPSYLVLEDIPFKFIGVPFGFFPSQKEFSSGIMVPKYGEENKRGFFLRDGGYYFGISDKMDLAVTGDIYSKGSWGGDIQYNYVKRYKFRSKFNFTYAEFVTGEKGQTDYEKSKDLSIKWTHSQDAKANPNSKFSASVNYSTRSYDKFNSKTIDQLTTNSKSSSISYGKSWPGSPFRLNMNLKHSQNSNTNNVTLTLPVMTFNMDRQYPFRKKNSSGDTRWYEDIEVQYSSKMENRITTTDSLLFNGTKFSDFENGFQHDIPLSTNFKILKYFNLSPQIKYTGILYPNNIIYSTDTNSIVLDTETGKKYVHIDTIYNEQDYDYAHMIAPSISLSVGPNIYGMYQFKNPNSKIIAFRHVMTPSASISYVPDLGSMVSNYYGEYVYDTLGNTREYSIYENEIYSLPNAPGESGSISLGLNNNLEMKVRSNKDTSNTVKKIKILESFRISSSYNLFADSLNWSQISIKGRTSMFENKLGINFGATVDPYALNDDGRVYNEFYWNETREDLFLKRIGRLERFDFSLNFKLNSKKGEEDDNSQKDTNVPVGGRMNARSQEMYDYQQQVMTYVDFDIPWNLNVDYKFVYSKPIFEEKITQTLSLSGDVSLTKKWKISMKANFDVENKKLTTSSINIHRDLHCWEMRFTWIPVGRMQSYSFQINVKGSTLRDFLKWDKRKSWQDNL